MRTELLASSRSIVGIWKKKKIISLHIHVKKLRRGITCH